MQDRPRLHTNTGSGLGAIGEVKHRAASATLLVMSSATVQGGQVSFLNAEVPEISDSRDSPRCAQLGSHASI